MKRELLIFVIIASFIASMSYAQQKLTEEQALRLIQQYKQREEKANAKIKEEETKIKELEKAIAELDERIVTLQAELAKAKQEPAKPEYRIYRVQPGDWLAKLAEYREIYGHGYYALWRVIYDANRDLIRDPTLIYPGWELKIPQLSEEEKKTKNREILRSIRGR